MTFSLGVISALWRHPIKGFTPEPVSESLLTPDEFFPYDRLYAFEVGASGFDAKNPVTIPKMRFAVLARFAAVARLHTCYNEYTEAVSIRDSDGQEWRFDVSAPAGRHAMERHVETVLAQYEDDYDPVLHPLKLLQAPGFDEAHSHFRFTDSGKGFVSFLNLNSVRELGRKINIDLDPLRMRANIWLESLSAFEDHGWVGRHIRVGEDGPEFEVLKPIVRCVATHVNPETAERDIDLCTALWEHYGHRDCGIYARILKGGHIRPGDSITVFRP